MKRPDWLEPLGSREEKVRAAHGLTAKRDGWYKSIGGKTKYICKPMPVLEAVQMLERRQRGGGAVVRILPAALTLEQLVEMFLAAMLERVTTGAPKKMARRTYDDYVETLDRFVEAVGSARAVVDLGPEDFAAFAKTFAGKADSTRRREIQNVDRLFNWSGPGAKGRNLIPFVMRGPDWIKPEGIGEGDKSYSPAQVKAAFDAISSDVPLNAFAHLGLNCGFIPQDISSLPDDPKIVRLDESLIVFPRGKTNAARVCHLMPETVAALRAYIAYRAKIKSVQPAAAGLFFRTREGFPYLRQYLKADVADVSTKYNLISHRWTAVVGLPFTGLRTTLATLADDWHDARAVDMLLGHKTGKVGRHVRTIHYAKQFNPDRVRQLALAVWPRAFGRAAPSSQSPLFAADVSTPPQSPVAAQSTDQVPQG